MMNTLIIIGAGGHGRVVADAAIAAGWSNIHFYDDAYPTIQQIGPWQVHGTLHDLLQKKSTFPVIVAIGNNCIRIDKANQLKQAGFHFATIVHPAATVSPSAKIGEGTVVFAGVVVNSCAVIEDHCIINTHATIEHDCHLKTAVHVSPNAALGGGTSIGKLSWIGIGASLKHCLTIGESVIVGMGAAVVKDLPHHCTAVGVPARIVERC